MKRLARREAFLHQHRKDFLMKAYRIIGTMLSILLAVPLCRDLRAHSASRHGKSRQ